GNGFFFEFFRVLLVTAFLYHDDTPIIDGYCLLLKCPVHSTRTVAGSGPNPFSDCGIGAALFTKTKWAAVSSNIIWDIGTTAVTSATASPETCSGKTIETAQLIHRTYDELLEETARGNGSHLTSMLNMMGCENSSHVAATSDIRIKLATEITNPNYQLKTAQEKSSAYYDTMNSAVAANCSS
ncbi:MAG: hypothetical protein ACJAW0_000538, partial [Zhongshania sp.]